MKVVFVGGGSHRYLSVARSILAENVLFDDGEINVYDLDQVRAEAMGRMIMKCPEYQNLNCEISWGTTLEEALEGADVVIVVLMAGNPRTFQLSQMVCGKHGFLGSDQLSPSGAMLALKGGPILLNIAEKMEKLCPNAVLLDFANPVAVLSAAVNNHSKIKCLGVCAGYTNHQWDISRILGKDELCADNVINCAGVNHMSFILPGSTWKGADLYETLDRHLTDDWKMPELSDRWQESTKRNILHGIPELVRLYRKFGYMIFSSEGDGVAHLDIENIYLKHANRTVQLTDAELDSRMEQTRKRRQEADYAFQEKIKRDIHETEWYAENPECLYMLREDQNIMVRIIKAFGGIQEMRIATSYPNNGAVNGFKDRTILEYSQIIDNNGIRPAGNFEIPDILYGLVSSLANHQTLLGDAIASKDPKTLFAALYSYPVKQDTAESKALWKELITISKDDIPVEFQKTVDYLT